MQENLWENCLLLRQHVKVEWLLNEEVLKKWNPITQLEKKQGKKWDSRVVGCILIDKNAAWRHTADA